MRSRLFSRLRRANSSRSSEVRPSLRRPSSRSARFTQFRIAPSDGSNSRASSFVSRSAGRATGYRRELSAVGAQYRTSRGGFHRSRMRGLTSAVWIPRRHRQLSPDASAMTRCSPTCQRPMIPAASAVNSTPASCPRLRSALQSAYASETACDVPADSSTAT